MTRQHRLSILLLMAAAGCADPAAAPNSREPTAPVRALSDATTDGREGFYFRPPMAPDVAVYPGSFDATLLSTLVVKICPIDGSGSCIGPAVSHTHSTKPAVTLDVPKERYGLNWAAAVGSYRVRVYSGATLLGYADVSRLTNGTYRASVPPSYVAVVRGATLPIRFRIEKGIAASVVVTRTEPTTNSAMKNSYPAKFSAVVTDLHGATVLAPAVVWSTSDPSVSSVGGSIVSGVAIGTVTALGDGEVIIRGSSGGFTGAAPELRVFGDPAEAIGASTVPITQRDVCNHLYGQTCESLAGDVTADAMRSAYGVEFAITNAGGIRTDMTCPSIDVATDQCPPYTPPPYTVLRGQVVIRMLPFWNRVVTLTVTGAELKAVLENGVRSVPNSHGRFAQVSGLCFTYDIQGALGSRVVGAVRQASDGSCTGGAVDLTGASSYTIAENDFMATGGDSYPSFAGRFTTRGYMDRVLVTYLQGAGVLSPTIQGRRKCIDSDPATLPNCPPGSP